MSDNKKDPEVSGTRARLQEKPKPVSEPKPMAKQVDAKEAHKSEPARAPTAAVTQAPRGASETSKPRVAYPEPTLQAVDQLEAEALAICLASDVRPLAGLAGVVDWRMCGRLSDLLRRGVITGAAREKVLLPTLGMIPCKRIFLFGWGPRAGLLDGATQRFAWMVDVLLQAKIDRVAVALPEPSTMLFGLVDEHLR
ncbi:MAG TPA: M17 family peptidase N-terminal domain-containing protein, partial [Myxococcota bacterium]